MLRDASRSGSSNTAQAGRASYDALESSVPVDDDDDGEELATVSSSYHHRQPAARRGSVSARDRSLSRTVSSDRGSDLRGWTATRAQHEQAAGGGAEDGDFGEADDNEPPQWFVPKPGHAGALIVKFDSMAVRWVVFGTMALGGASFSSLFFLSAWCDGKSEGIGTSRPRTSMLAGAGFTVFWIAIVFLAWQTTCTRLLRWHSDDRTSRAEQLARQLFVSGVGGRFENENQLSAVFEKFGRVVQATVRVKVDDLTGKNKSWAMVTMEDGAAAARVINAAASLPTPIRPEMFSQEKADASTGAMGRIRKRVAKKFELKLGIIQKLAQNTTISDSMVGSLRCWRQFSLGISLGIFSIGLSIGAACIELIARDRSRPDQFWPLGVHMAELLPDQYNDNCISDELTNTLLILVAIFHTLGGVFTAAIATWFMMGVGLGANLASDHTSDLRRNIAYDPMIWPMVSPIRQMNELTGVLVPDPRDGLGVHVLRSPSWIKDTKRATEMWHILCSIRAKHGSFAALKRRAAELLVDASEAEMLRKLSALCDANALHAVITDADENTVMAVLGHWLIDDRRNLVADDVAWEIEVRRPAVHLARHTMGRLRSFSASITALFVGCGSLLAVLPYAVATGNVFAILFVSFSPIPLVILWPVAELGTSCDDLMNELNDVRSDGLRYEDGYKVESLRSYLMDLNTGQGLGFMLFGTVLDRRKLVKFGGLAASGLSSAILALIHFNEK